MLVLIRDVVASADQLTRLHGQLARHEHVVVIHGRSHRYRVLGQHVRQVHGRRLRRRRENLRDALQRRQARILVEHAAHEVLARQVERLALIQRVRVLREARDLLGQAIRRPARRRAHQVRRCARVDVLLEHGVNRGHVHLRADCRQELRREPALATNRRPGALEQVVQLIRVALPAQHHADHAQTRGGEALARRQRLFCVRQVRAQLAHRPLIARVALEVRAVAGRRALIRQAVDVVHMDEAGQASRDQAGLQALGSQRQVRGRDEAAERLAERRPRVIPAQLATQRLRVVHDLILAEVAQVRGLLLVRVQVGERLGVHARGLAGSSLIEEHHAVILQETIHPPAGKRAETRTRVARSPLEEHRVGRVLAALAHDLARENLNRWVVLASGAQVIKGNVQAVFVNGVTVVQVRLCVHVHNPIVFASPRRVPRLAAGFPT